MTDQLPRGWAEFSLAELVEPGAPILYGILQPGPELADGVPYVRPTEIRDGVIKLDEVRRTSREIANKYARASLREGDIVLSIVGTIGKVAVVPAALNGANITQSSVRIRPGPSIDGALLAAMLASPQFTSQYDKHRLGTGVPRLNVAHVRELRCAVPPLREQRRIVAKLETLQARSRRAREALDAVPPLLEKLRQSILAAAFRGDLTKDWREHHRDVEPANSLLERRLPLPTKYARLTKRAKPTPVTFDDTLFPPLPRTWCYATVTQLYDAGLLIDFADGNHGSEYPRASEFGDQGETFVTASQIARGAVDFSSCPLLNATKAARLRKGWAEGGDVLLTHNATVGRVALVPEDVPRFLLGTSVTFYRVNPLGLLSQYLFGAMLSPTWQAQLVAVMEQTTRNQVSIQKQAFFRVPLAPLEEQVVVAQRIRSALTKLDALEDAMQSSAAQLTALKRSILAKAFRGELVSQDPSDEAAEVMLSRFRAANGDATEAKPKRQKVLA